jgi:hypothetical protein
MLDNVVKTLGSLSQTASQTSNYQGRVKRAKSRLIKHGTHNGLSWVIRTILARGAGPTTGAQEN